MYNRFFRILFVLLFVNAISAKAKSVEIDISAEGCSSSLRQILSDTLSFVLTAEPSEGYEFAVWSDGVTDNPRIISTKTNDISVLLRAIFIPILQKDDPKLSQEYTIVVKANGCSKTYSANHYYGDVLSITATPDATCGTFLQWSDGNTDNPRSVVVTGDAAYTAVFERKQYTVTATADNAEQGSVSITAE